MTDKQPRGGQKPREPLILRYEHFRPVGQRWHAISPLYGDQVFGTSTEAKEWLSRLVCDNPVQSVMYADVCKSCGGDLGKHSKEA